MRTLLFWLALALPYLGQSQSSLSHLSCNKATGKMVWKMGSETRTYIWVKKGHSITYFKIDDLKVIELNQAIQKLIENYEKDIWTKRSCRLAGSKPQK